MNTLTCLKTGKSQKQPWMIKANYRTTGTVYCVPLYKDQKHAKQYVHVKYTNAGLSLPQETNLLWTVNTKFRRVSKSVEGRREDREMVDGIEGVSTIV